MAAPPAGSAAIYRSLCDFDGDLGQAYRYRREGPPFGSMVRRRLGRPQGLPEIESRPGARFREAAAVH